VEQNTWQALTKTFVVSGSWWTTGTLLERLEVDYAPALDPVDVEFRIQGPEWEKRVNGQLWRPGLTISATTSDTITVTDIVTSMADFAIVESWDPARLTLVEVITSAGIVAPDPGVLIWEVPAGPSEPVTLTKVFHVEPCTWTETVLREEFWLRGQEWETRLVFVDHVPDEPEPVWVKEISIGEHGPFGPGEMPFEVLPDDVITIVDHVWITHCLPVSFTLEEAWGPELVVGPVNATTGSLTISPALGTVTWSAQDLPPNTWQTLTKTFTVSGTDWETSTVMEVLTVTGAPPLPPIPVDFVRGSRDVYLPLVLRQY
jgi:hypothetical protein